MKVNVLIIIEIPFGFFNFVKKCDILSLITLRKVNLIDIDLRNENPDLLFKLQLIDSYNYLYQNDLIDYLFVFPSKENKKLKEIKEKQEKEKK